MCNTMMCGAGVRVGEREGLGERLGISIKGIS